MPVQITIRNVPEEVRDALAGSAARQHQSMQALGGRQKEGRVRLSLSVGLGEVRLDQSL